MYKMIDLVQGSPEWHDFRKGKIGSSAAAAVMGKSRFDTPRSLYRRMKGLDPEIEDNFAMARGRREEPHALAWACQKLGADFDPAVLQSVEHPEIIASLDGFCAFLGYGIEIKTPRKDDHADAIFGEIPEAYRIQMQHQMLVSGAQKWVYVSWDGSDGVCVEVKRDEAFIKKLLEAEIDFLGMLDRCEEPALSEQDALIVDEASLVEHAKSLADAEAHLKEAEERVKCLKASLIERVKDMHTKVRIGGCVELYKSQRAGCVDYKAIPELANVNLDLYRKKPVVYWGARYLQ